MKNFEEVRMPIEHLSEADLKLMVSNLPDGDGTRKSPNLEGGVVRQDVLNLLLQAQARFKESEIAVVKDNRISPASGQAAATLAGLEYRFEVETNYYITHIFSRKKVVN